MTIKQKPQDFIVTERLTDEWQKAYTRRSGQYAIYLLQKTSLTTPDCVGLMARALGVPYTSIQAAGLKDRHAETSQHVSVDLSRLPIPPDKVSDRYWQALRKGYADEHLSAKAIASNEFSLVIRRLSRSDLDTMRRSVGRLTIRNKSVDSQENQTAGFNGEEVYKEEASAEQRLDSPRRQRHNRNLLITNYFGNQRFGSARSGEGFVGSYLVKGDYETALRLLIATPHRKEMASVKAFKTACRDLWGQWTKIKNMGFKTQPAKVMASLIKHPQDFRAAFSQLPYFEQQICVEAYQSWLWNRITTVFLEETLSAEQYRSRKDRYGTLIFPTHDRLSPKLLSLKIPHLTPKSQLKPPWDTAVEKILNTERIDLEHLCLPGLRRPAFQEVHRPVLVTATEFKMGKPSPDELNEKKKKVRLDFVLPRGSYATVLLRALGQ